MSIEYMKLIDRFLNRQLSAEEVDKFWELLFQNPALYKEVELTANLISLLRK